MILRAIDDTDEIVSGTAALTAIVRVTRSFSLRVDFEGLTSRAPVKYTCLNRDETTLVWVDRADVSELCGLMFVGCSTLNGAS